MGFSYETSIGAATMNKVLCVDDASSNLSLVGKVLSLIDGVEVILASNAEAALGLAQAHAPQVMVLDLRMPHMDGYELMRKLKTLPAIADSRYIALTALARPEDKTQALSAGFDHYICKPFDIHELMQTVKDCLR